VAVAVLEILLCHIQSPQGSFNLGGNKRKAGYDLALHKRWRRRHNPLLKLLMGFFKLSFEVESFEVGYEQV
jgi:hypothetical protein